jgi:hypothetical protein
MVRRMAVKDRAALQGRDFWKENKMKAWWKRATRAKTATELTGAEIKRLAAELSARASMASFVRVASGRSGLGLETQRQALDSFATAHAFKIIREFV